MAFKCAIPRHKGGRLESCHGFMQAQLLNSEKGQYLLYCSKCAAFFIARPSDSIYHLRRVRKEDIDFIDMPYVLDKE